MTEIATVGEKIRAARQLRGLTQADLANNLVSTSMMSQIEMNKTRPSTPLLQVIAQRLAMPLEHFVDDLDEGYTPDVQLAIAHYHLLLRQTEAAKSALSPEVTAFDARYTKYKQMFAQMLLQAKQYAACTRILEELREYALFSQDKETLLVVYQLSGYSEYDTENWRAAIHEWEHALTIGEGLINAPSRATLHVEATLADISFAIYRAYMRLGEKTRADAQLEKAMAYSAPWADVRTLAASLYSDALHSLRNTEDKKPLDLLEKAAWTLELSIGLTARSRIMAEHRTHGVGTASVEPFDSWLNTATALTAGEPVAAFETDITWIRYLLDQQRYDTAMIRIGQCKEMLPNFPLDPVDFMRIRYQLLMLQAECEFASGQPNQAVVTLKTAIEEADGHLSVNEILLGQYLLLRWVREHGDENMGQEVVHRVMELLKADSVTSGSLYMD